MNQLIYLRLRSKSSMLNTLIFWEIIFGDFISKEKIKCLDAVASHGHTVFHQPEKD